MTRAQQVAKSFRSLSIRGQIGFATAAVFVPLIACVTISAAYVSSRQVQEFVRQDLASTAYVLADRLTRNLVVRYEEVRTLSRLQPLQSVWQNDPAALRAVLEELQSSYPDYSWIGFADTQGKVVAATRGMLEGASVAARPWFKNGLAGPTVEDVHDAKLLESLLGPRPSGEPFRFVDVAYPVQDAQGRTIGVLGAHLSWDFAAALRQSMLAASPPGTISDLLVLAKNGEVLLGGATGSQIFPLETVRKIMKEPTGTLVQESDAGRHLVGYSSGSAAQTPNLGWIVVARQPYSEALAPVYRMIAAVTFIGLVAAALGLMLALGIARGIARPLLTLTNEADLLGRDPNARTLPRVGGSREVVRLSTSLRALLRRIDVAEQRSQAAETRASLGAEQYAHDLRLLRVMADTDPLTGLLNRRAFLSAAADAFDYFKRYDRAVATLIIDIDHFKAVNDTYGHAAGDAVIKRVGEIIDQSLRTTDKIGRFGGEEYVVLLREVDEEQARHLGKRIRDSIAAESIGFGSQSIAVTASIGVTLAAETDRDVQDTIERADRALYMAKNTGRNRAFLLFATNPDDFRRVA